MAKKRQEEPKSFDNIMQALADGTSFQVGIESLVLTARKRVRTPLIVVNCLLGGGLPFGTIIQSYGPPKAGKSTFLYQMMAEFQASYPEGIACILDMESSADNNRLTYFGVDTSKVLRLPASSIETGFQSLMKMLENKSKIESLRNVPVFVIWDTISKGLAQEGSTQSRVNAMDRARIIKNYMSPLMSEIEKHDFILGLLNQVVFKQDFHGNVKMDSGGGISLKHDVHVSTVIEICEDFLEDGAFLVQRMSKMSIDKNKLGPEVYHIPILMDSTQGGKIDEILSFFYFMHWRGYIANNSGWYSWEKLIQMNEDDPFIDILHRYHKKFRLAEIKEYFQWDELFVKVLSYLFMKQMSIMYKLQSAIIQEYMIQVRNEIRQDYDHPEYYLLDNPEKFEDFFISTFSSNLENATNKFGKISHENTSEADAHLICLNCGKIHNKIYKCDACLSEYVVHRDTAMKILELVENKIKLMKSEDQLTSEDGEVVNEQEIVEQNSDN